ncbi:hypothetical protein CC1G_13746 [Coprinopsis cinerea okayama7|uniref:Uncharacterized protein n=1 Tax=Coprinopsis cinerea (strain Okayama-7 / 130 / ATCC MYA-4618 / FGSC 9003) TaxID=240176 RepID=D6RK74_COPC7|nr:hypothetical protein CC1G_13746 [Coprinopsis cinerea okayama7\|eukprot:XP_002912214.1 hypothetical protein CC1G_13746 [Coprinopsis cinerea okayama7\
MILSVAITYLLDILLFFVGLSGHVVRISRIDLWRPAIKGITYSRHRKGYHAMEVSVGSVTFQPHLPRPSAPYFGTIIIDDVSVNQIPQYSGRIQQVKAILWLLPTLFRFTAGPIVTAEVHDFLIDVTESRMEPSWLRAIRLNLVETILRGETLRVNEVKSKVWLWEPATGPRKTRIQKGEEEAEEGLKEEGVGEESEEEPPDKEESSEATPSDGDDEEDGNDFINEKVEFKDTDDTETRARISAFQAMLHNFRNNRMYSMGRIDTEIKRPWGAPPWPASSAVDFYDDEDDAWTGSLLLRIADSNWTKIPRVGETVSSGPWSVAKSLVFGFLTFPIFVSKALWDPLQYVDLVCTNAEMNYRQFRLRDAELFVEAGKVAYERYSSLQDNTKRILEDWAWELFVGGLSSAFGLDEPKVASEVKDNKDVSEKASVDNSVELPPPIIKN